MASEKRLGVYSGATGFTLVQLENNTPAIGTFVPFVSPEDVAHPVDKKHLPKDMQILDALQKSVRSKGFSTQETFLSIPSKDIIIRWFSIPWMKSSEIQDVVIFEAKKYIPFPINELSYTYFPSNIQGSNPRQIGIIFVAIRKDVFEKHSDALMQAGINVIYSEPASASLFRALVFRKIVDPEELTAIVYVDGYTGELLICEKGYVKFIREFSLQGGVHQGVSALHVDDELRSKVYNEVRISSEFFLRQYGGEEVRRMVAISIGGNSALWDKMGEELGVHVEIVDVSRLVDHNDCNSMAAVYAYGVAMMSKVIAVIDFNLFEGSKQQVSLKQVEIDQRRKALILPLAVGAGVFTLIFSGSFFTDQLINNFRKEVVTLEREIGGYVDIEESVAVQQKMKSVKKLFALKSLTFDARATKILVRLVKRLPSGFWLESVSLSFKDEPVSARKVPEPGNKEVDYYSLQTKTEMTFSGYVSLKDNNIEFEMVNHFFNALSSDNLFATNFTQIKIVSLQVREYDNKKVTAFSITCEAK